MIKRRSNLRLISWSLLLSGMVLMNTARAGTNVVLHLRNGDRVTGAFVSETTNHLSISNVWSKELIIPLSQIERREKGPDAPAPATTPAQASTEKPPAPVAPAPVPAPAPAPPPVVVAQKPKEPSTVPQPAPMTVAPPKKTFKQLMKNWRVDAAVGTDLLYGAKDRQIYHGRLKVTYTRPYQDDPKSFFRNIFDYLVEFGETDGVESQNRMEGSSKTDFDVGRRVYVYNLGSVGYDVIRKIDLSYEIGPGAGYHLFTLTNFIMNVEAGLNYQVQERSDNTRTDNFYYRIAQDITWKLNSKLVLIQKAEFFPGIEDFYDFRARFEATLSYSLLQNVSFNLSVLDTYDASPAAGVSDNELQIRSTLGFRF